MRVRVLGPLEVSDGREVRRIGAAKQRALLAALVVRAGTPVSVDRLVEEVWDGKAPASAVNLVQGYVAALRRALDDRDGALLRTQPPGYQLVLGDDELDLRRFEALVERGRTALTGGDSHAASVLLTEAKELWRGQPFADVPASPAVEAEAGRLEQLRLAALEARADAYLDLGRHAELVPELQTLTASHPLLERFWAQLMLALYRSGRQAHALAAYQRLYGLLDDELGIEPSRPVRELHQQILARDTTLDAPAAQPGATPAGSLMTRQLPAGTSDFTGRQEELAQLDALVPAGDASPASALVVSAITGTAGIGKTALAVHLAHRLVDRYPDGQLFVDLHGHTPAMGPRGPGEALDYLLRALGVPGVQIPDGVEDRAALYRSRLAGRRMLVVLDNAATEDQVAPLLPGSPGCLVLITSRRRLAGLDAHTLSLEVLATRDAVDLFLRAAGAQRLAGQPPGELVELVELCGRLPLAIRIAGARLRSHPAWRLSHLVDRLRAHQHRLAELEVGQRSVTAALDLSYQHLDAGQQRTYRLLGLHPGPDIDPYATAALLGATARQAARILDQLLDANLLHEPVVDRYRFHDLTRAHAIHTAHTGDTEPDRRAALTRLFDHYRHTAAVAMDVAYPYERDRRPQVPPADTPTPALPDPVRATAWLDAELPNLLATAAYAAEHGWPRHTLHLSAVLHLHLRTRGSYIAAETLHRQAAATARATGEPASELDALTGLGYICLHQGKYPQAIEHYQQALDIARTIGRPAGELFAQRGLGQVHVVQGRYAQAAGEYQQALRLARMIGHRGGELAVHSGLGEVCWMQGRYPQAANHFWQALRLARVIGHPACEMDAHSGLGGVHLIQGQYGPAANHFRQALRLARTIGHRGGELYVRNGLGGLHLHQGRYARAAEHYQRVLDLAREIGNRNYEYEALQGLGRLHHATGQLVDAVAFHRRALALATELEQPADQSRAHDGLAHAHQDLGRPDRARQHWQQALDLLTSLGIDHTQEAQVNVRTLHTHLD